MRPVHLILGAPGCGKTTTLLNLVDDALQSGILPHEIGFISFTRKAANEAADRACKKFGFNRKQLPYFRTLHSSAFRGLGMTRNDVLTDYSEIADAVGIPLNVKTDSATFLPSGTGKYQEIPFLEALARNRCITLEEQWHDWQEINPGDFIDWHIMHLYERTLRGYKHDMGLLDYTDILNQFIKQKMTLPVKLLIIDEAQDLSRLQWEMVACASQGVQRVVVAGDDDQSIFEWAGADIRTFLHLKGTQEILKKSHRLPERIFEVAQEVAGRIRNRYPKTWYPRAEKGDVTHINELDQLYIKPHETYMFLARNHYLLGNVVEYIRSAGYFYSLPHKEHSVKNEYLTAIRYWEKLRNNELINVEAVQLVYDYMLPMHGISADARASLKILPDDTELSMNELLGKHGLRTQSIWHEALTGIPAEEREYILLCLRNGEKLSREPRIYIGTIHSVKGGEAENVVFIPDLSRLSWKTYQNNEDAENRVLYVGITRARKHLTILFPQTSRYYFI